MQSVFESLTEKTQNCAPSVRRRPPQIRHLDRTLSLSKVEVEKTRINFVISTEVERPAVAICSCRPSFKCYSQREPSLPPCLCFCTCSSLVVIPEGNLRSIVLCCCTCPAWLSFPKGICCRSCLCCCTYPSLVIPRPNLPCIAPSFAVALAFLSS